MQKDKRINFRIWLGLLALVCACVLIRFPASQTNGFHNEDAAGILYNAQLINQGGLPLVDTLELKAPGSFFVVASFWRFFPDTITSIQTLGIIWSIVAMLGIYFGGQELFDRRSGFLSAVAYLLLSPIMDSIDINYGAWMIAPMIWSSVCFIRWMKRDELKWLIWAGILLAVAGLLKRQGAVLTPLFMLLIAYVGSSRNADTKVRVILRNTTLLLVGIGLGFLPILLFYGAHGELLNFIKHYFFSPGGWQYLDTLTWSEKIVRLSDGALGFLEYGSLATVLAVFALLGWFNQGQDDRRDVWSWYFLVGLLLFSIAGLSLGFRFFKGYYLQTLPALVWMLGAPSGIRKLMNSPTAWLTKSMVTLLVAMCLAPFLVKDFQAIDAIRSQRHQPRDLSAQRIARLIKKETKPHERIWVWGRAAWPIYVHAERLAATRYPKTLAVFTTNLTNTWRRGTQPTTFEPRSDWKPLIDQLNEQKPSFIVLAHNERYGTFTALQTVLRTQYTRRKSPARGFSVYSLNR